MALRFCMAFVALVAFAAQVQANCYYVSPDLVRSATEARARGERYLKNMTGKKPTDLSCFLGTYMGESTWLCEERSGDCSEKQMQANALADEMLEYGERRGSLLPDGQGWYDVWPSGERVFCDRAFGCRRY